MVFNFFTSGGSYTWEDLFVYNNWRIQRHYLYKDYRLLDNFDIEREYGTFEKCNKSFLEYIKAYEMEKPKEHLVIMIHGLNEHKGIFNNIQKKMNEEGFATVAINYPSTKKNIDSHVRQLNVLMSNLSDITQVSFITKGIGGIILRKLLNYKSEWKKHIRIKKIIQISPPNKGSRFLTKMSEYKPLRWKLGPAVSELTPSKIAKVPLFPKSIELGIIHCDYPFKKIASFMPRSFKNYLPSQVESDIDNPNKSLYINSAKLNERVANACIRFLKDGLF